MIPASNFVDMRDKLDLHILKKFIITNANEKNCLKIPYRISLSNELLRTLYTIVGDGCLHKGVYMSNINYRIHRDFIETLEKKFYIPLSKLRFSLTFNQDTRVIHIKNAINFWLKVLPLKKVNHLYKTQFNTCKQGAAKTIFDHKPISKFLSVLLKEIKNKIYNKELTDEQICCVLDGILNAEGSANIDTEKKGLHKIVISFNKYNLEEKELFAKVLDLAGNKYNTHLSGKHIVSRWINQYTFIKFFTKEKIKPFSLSPKRALNLFKGFLNHQRTSSILKYLSVINKKEKITIQEITNYLGCNRSSVEEAILRKFRPFGFFKIENRGVNKDPYTISITEEGKRFLNSIHILKQWLAEVEKDYKEDIQLLYQIKEV